MEQDREMMQNTTHEGDWGSDAPSVRNTRTRGPTAKKAGTKRADQSATNMKKPRPRVKRVITGARVRWNMERLHALSLIATHQCRANGDTHWAAAMRVFNHLFGDELRNQENSFPNGIQNTSVLCVQWHERFKIDKCSRWIAHEQRLQQADPAVVAAIATRVLEAERVLSQIAAKGAPVIDPALTAAPGTDLTVPKPRHAAPTAAPQTDALAATSHELPNAVLRPSDAPGVPSQRFIALLKKVCSKEKLPMLHIGGLNLTNDGELPTFDYIPYHNSPFVRPNEKVFVDGGQAGRVNFIDSSSGAGSVIEVAFCISKYCDICCKDDRAAYRVRDATTGYLFVHRHDLSLADDGETHVFDPFLTVNYDSNQHAAGDLCDVVFSDGIKRQVMLCDPLDCTVCPSGTGDDDDADGGEDADSGEDGDSDDDAEGGDESNSEQDSEGQDDDENTMELDEGSSRDLEPARRIHSPPMTREEFDRMMATPLT